MHTKNSIEGIKKLRTFEQYIEDYKSWRKAKAKVALVSQTELKNRCKGLGINYTKKAVEEILRLFYIEGWSIEYLADHFSEDFTAKDISLIVRGEKYEQYYRSYRESYPEESSH